MVIKINLVLGTMASFFCAYIMCLVRRVGKYRAVTAPIYPLKQYTILQGKPDMMKKLILTSEDVRALPTCKQVGLVYPWFGPDAARLAKTIMSAEAAGVRQLCSCAVAPI